MEPEHTKPKILRNPFDDRQLRRMLVELERLAYTATIAVESGLVPSNPKVTSKPYDLILGGKYGITLLTPINQPPQTIEEEPDHETEGQIQ